MTKQQKFAVLERCEEEGISLLFAELFHRLAGESIPEEAQAAFEKGLIILERAKDMAKQSLEDMNWSG